MKGEFGKLTGGKFEDELEDNAIHLFFCLFILTITRKESLRGNLGVCHGK